MKRIVQRSPNVGLTFRLRRQTSCPEPVVVAAPAPTDCSVTSIVWATIPTITGAYSSQPPNVWPSQGRSTHWVLRPMDEAIDPAWPATVIAVPLGSGVSGVRWEWSWDAPPVFSYSVTETPPILVVTIPPVPYGGEWGRYYWTLTVNALCGDSLVGSLTLYVSIPR